MFTAKHRDAKAITFWLQVKFQGRGNLVIAPPTLAPQWEDEIHKMTVRKQVVIIVDDMKHRKLYKQSVAGMQECALAHPASAHVGQHLVMT